MQLAVPILGTAQREMSRIESEGHSSAASFIDIPKQHLPRQRKLFSGFLDTMNLTVNFSIAYAHYSGRMDWTGVEHSRQNTADSCTFGARYWRKFDALI